MELVGHPKTMGGRLVLGTFLWEYDLTESVVVAPMGRWGLLVLVDAIVFNRKKENNRCCLYALNFQG